MITGEATYRGLMPVDGIISGNLGAVASVLTVKQRPNGSSGSLPELNGEITFKDMLRINGHVAGKICSPNGTLIVDGSARVVLVGAPIRTPNVLCTTTPRCNCWSRRFCRPSVRTSG